MASGACPHFVLGGMRRIGTPSVGLGAFAADSNSPEDVASVGARKRRHLVLSPGATLARDAPADVLAAACASRRTPVRARHAPCPWRKLPGPGPGRRKEIAVAAVRCFSCRQINPLLLPALCKPPCVRFVLRQKDRASARKVLKQLDAYTLATKRALGMRKISVTFREPLPSSCPPDNCTGPTSDRAWRLLKAATVTNEDFDSAVVKQPSRNFPDMCYARGISLVPTIDMCRSIVKSPRMKAFTHAVAVTCDAAAGVWHQDSETHVSWWIFDNIQPLSLVCSAAESLR